MAEATKKTSVRRAPARKGASKAKPVKKKFVGALLPAALGGTAASWAPLLLTGAGGLILNSMAKQGTKGARDPDELKKIQDPVQTPQMKKGGRVRGDGRVIRGKTRGKMC